MGTEIQPDGFSLNKPLPPELYPNIDHLVTEDDTPVDNIYSEKQQRLLVDALHNSWRRDGNAPFVAFANVGLFYILHGTPFVSDMMLSLDVSLPENIHPKRFRSYFVWEYGKPPDVVVEVVSNNVGGEDDAKLKGYANIGVKYYVIYDPELHLSQTALKAYKLDGSDYVLLAEPFYFSGIGLGLRLWDGKYEDHSETWLRWYNSRGDLIPTGGERAESAEVRAESAEERAKLAEERASRLALKLRELGLDPDA